MSNTTPNKPNLDQLLPSSLPTLPLLDTSSATSTGQGHDPFDPSHPDPSHPESSQKYNSPLQTTATPIVSISPAQDATPPGSPILCASNPTPSGSNPNAAGPSSPSTPGRSAYAHSGSSSVPSSPTGSAEPFVGVTTSLGLRQNVDPEATRAHYEKSHNRNPSGALSFASTVPDQEKRSVMTAPGSSTAASSPTHSRTHEQYGMEMGKSERNSSGNRKNELRPFSSKMTVTKAKGGEGDVKAEEVSRRKVLGISIPWTRAKPIQVVAPIVKADPTPEEMKPFSTALTPSALYNLIDPKSYEALKNLGGTEALLEGLKTNEKTGLDEKGEVTPKQRLRVYGINKVPERKGRTLLQLMWMAYQDKVLLILSVAAVVSLALGLYQDLGTPPTTYESTKCPNNLCVEPQVDWVEGVAITIAIFIVVMVGAINDYQKERQFRKLNAQKEERNVKCLRNGTERLMSVYDVVVGDILFVEPGEILPVDGIFLSGHNVRCDESGATGESDAVRKAPYHELNGNEKGKTDCFLLSGSKVLEGVGKYAVTGVGENSFHGRIMMSLRGDAETTPLQIKLNGLAELIAKLGSAAGLLLFSCLMIRFFVELARNSSRTADAKAQNFIQILIIAVTVVVVAVPEGLPLAVTLALSFATRRMTKQKLLVRVLGACETMANATVICTDKTGTLTQNTMSVVAGAIGVHLKFTDRIAENAARTNANDDTDAEKSGVDDEDKLTSKPAAVARKGRLDFSADMSEINRHLTRGLQKLLNDSIAINSTAFEGTDEHGAEDGFVGSKTETALLTFAKVQAWPHYKETRDAAKVVQMIPFSSERKAMGVVVELPDGTYRLMLKGASEVLAKLCTRHVVVNENISNEEAQDESVPSTEFTEETRANIARTIIFYANQSLRTIALCSRDFPSWPPPPSSTTTPTKMPQEVEGEVNFEDLAQDMTLVAVTAIEDPLREGVSQAVATCQRAGVQVKMCTGDNVLTARSIASQCGIFSMGGIIMEGPVFRKLTPHERMEVVPRLQVLARSSPEDKKILVEVLKSMGEVVGVTGDGTNDGPALKTANVGFSMGIAGTEVAKEASDIILMDDNFANIVSAIMWGRCVNDSVKKFLQFQISVNITAVVITFISAVASSDETSVLTAVQLLWVNLIMDTLAALALATDPATTEALDRHPDRKTAPLISVQMWMMITGQAIYQIIVALVLHFVGKMIFKFNSTDPGTAIDQNNELDTLVFNTFVFCQIFNQLNARRLDRGLNVFVNIWKNYYFIAIFVIMVGGQALIVNFGGSAFQVTKIGGRDWAISVVLGALSLPLAILIRLLPPEPFERFAIKLRLFPDPNAPLPTISPAREEQKWNEGIEKAIDNLQTFGQIRGGRLRSSSIVLKSRSRQMKDADIHPSALMAMIPSLVMGSIGAGWKPQEGSMSDPASSDPSKSSVQLFATGQHLETDDKNDPLATRLNRPAQHSRHLRRPSNADEVNRGHSRGPSLATIPAGGEATHLSVPSSPLR